MTYAQERAEKNRLAAQKATKYVFEPVLIDFNHPHVEVGQIVVKQAQPGCPKQGTMGHYFVADTEGRFLGLVHGNSLKKVGR